MKSTEVINQFLTAIESEDYNKAESLAADDLAVEGVSPTPLGKKEFLGVHRAISTGFPDFKFNQHIDSEHDGHVDVTVQLSGTNRRDMKAPIPGMKDIPATFKSIKMPKENLHITVKNDKISKLELDHVADGGLPGILKQLGVEMPKS